MKIVDWQSLLNEGEYESSPEYSVVESHLKEAVGAVVFPEGASTFTLNPTRKGNGVKPIKVGFTEYLKSKGWELETKSRKFDALFRFPDGDSLPFAVEWETGNISSSHRAINRIALGIREGEISGGVLVLPSAKMYPYLTDRIGNDKELRQYYKLWREFDLSSPRHYLGVVVVEHDDLSNDVPLIRKGTDGRALI